ncbi:MAG: glycosyltransferase family 4 protein [Phormidesmis sp.]
MVIGKSLDRDMGTAQQPSMSQSVQQTVASEQQDSALKLMILTQFFPPDFAATGQLIEELSKQLGQQGVDVTVFTGQPGYAFEKEDAPNVEQNGRVEVKRSRMSRLFPSRIRGKAVNGLLFAVRAILHLMRRSRQYDVMLVTTAPPFLPVIAYFANLLLGTSYVCLLYDLYPDIAIELEVIESNHLIAKIWRFLNQQIWRRAESIIVLSSSMERQVIKNCPDVASKISVIHSWSNEKQIVPLEKENNWFAKEHNLVDSFVVLYSGNMGRCHDIDTLFETACLLKDEPIVFVCIGGGAKRDSLKANVAACGLSNIRFLPYQEKNVLPYSLTASDLSLVSVAKGMQNLVAPSKLYPAMASGRPIAAICPPSSYLNELLKTVGCGAAFANGDSKRLSDYICELAHNQMKSKQLGQSGREYLEVNFTSEIIAQQYLTVVKSAAS